MYYKHLIKKLAKIIAGIIAVVTLICLILFVIGKPQKNILWGITFSTIRAHELGFNSQELFVTILNDLQPKKVRLPVYWSELEPQQGSFNFTVVDSLLSEADKRDVEVIVGLGKKQPRWPECHQPEWYNKLDTEQQDQAVLTMIQTAVARLKNHPSIVGWQIENEPYFQYGPDCPVTSHELYEKEMVLVKQLSDKPIIATDSGEKGAWVNVAWSGADKLGTTMYREAYYEKRGKYVTYPLPWWTYNVKAGTVKLLTGAEEVIGVELQAEPWLIVSNPTVTPPEEQLIHMNADIFQNNIDYATKVGFAENYLWGAEWWYWMQKEHGDGSMVKAAQYLFTKN
jgi:hypothetical protein